MMNHLGGRRRTHHQKADDSSNNRAQGVMSRRHLSFRRRGSSSGSGAAIATFFRNSLQEEHRFAAPSRPSFLRRDSSSWSQMDDDGYDDHGDDQEEEIVEFLTLTNRSTGTATTATSESEAFATSTLSQESFAIVTFVPAPTFTEAVEQWVQMASTFCHSRDFQNFMKCSQHVVWTASGLAMQTALLPITIPVKISRNATHLIVESCVHVVASTTSLLLQAIVPQQQHGAITTRTTSSEEEDSSSEQQQQHESSGLISNVLGLPWGILSAAIKVKDELGSMVVQAVFAPPPAQQQGKYIATDDSDCCHSQQHDKFLDRLRLDYYCLDTPLVDSYTSSNSCTVTATAASFAAPCAATRVTVVADASAYSKYLLPVRDLRLQHEGRTIYFIDLDSSDAVIISEALTQLVEVGISLLANHPTVRLGTSNSSSSPNNPNNGVPPPKLVIEWRPEGSTPKLLRKLHPLSTIDRLKVLEQEILVWSGSLSGSKLPFFLARGIVKKSPLSFMQMLWSDNRTSEYNNFCLGRTSILVLQDTTEEEQPCYTGTKVVHSETRVPFTSLSVVATCLMHVRPLEQQGPDDEGGGGFIIVSRSLWTGAAGTNYSTDHVHPNSKNEILWGINIFRRVPNHPHLTDLTSLSQVGSNLVPQFLATRIGLMGIEDFFKNVRLNKAPTPQQN